MTTLRLADLVPMSVVIGRYRAGDWHYRLFVGKTWLL